MQSNYSATSVTFSSNEPTPWKCPCCMNYIIDGPKERYQTLDEHVCNPNGQSPMRTTLICSNEKCITRKNDTFWDSYGDMYGGIGIEDSEFINSNNSPFGSLGRKLNVEIYKVGLKKKTYLPPFLLLWFYQPVIEYTYKADEFGNVLKRGFNIIYLKKDDGHFNNTYCIHVTPFWRTWKFLWDRFKRNINRYEDDLNSRHLESAFKPSYNRAWVYRSFEKIVQILYPNYFKQYKSLNIEK